ADLNVPTYLLVRGDDRTPDKSTPLAPGVPEALGGTFEVTPVSLPRDAYEPDRRAFVTEEQRAALKAEVVRTRAALVPKLAASIVVDSNPLRFATKLAAANAVNESLALLRLDAEIAADRLDAFEMVLK